MKSQKIQRVTFSVILNVLTLGFGFSEVMIDILAKQWKILFCPL